MYLIPIIILVLVVIAIIVNLSEFKLLAIDEKIKEKGKEGELIVNYYLKDLEDEGKVLNNLYIPTVRDQTTEIDTVFLTRDAIFIIESKNINGDIKGNYDDENWQSIREDRIQDFRNPIKQNATHIKYLNNQLKQLIPIYSIIAFNDEADLDNINIDNKHVKVIHYSELVRTIKEELKDSCHFINVGEFNTMYTKLLKFTNVSEEVKIKHDNYIKENYG